MRVSLALLATLPLLAVGSGATAGASSSTPPRNGLIAIHGGNGGLYLVDPGTGSTAPIPGAEDAADGAWSPDGTRLAFTLWSEDDIPSIYTMKPDGTDRALVIHNASTPAWSPDGESLAVVREGADRNQLAVVRVNSDDERVLLPRAGATPTFFSTLAWSPDGKLIAFIDEQGSIGLVAPDGKNGGVFDVQATGNGLSWSPDSSRLAFDAYRESKSESGSVVVVLDLATGNETALAGEQQGAQAPEWSPEGDQIAFLSMELTPSHSTTTAHCGGEPYVTHLWSMRPDGTKAHPLAESAFFGRASWGRAADTSAAPAPAADQKPVPAPAPVADQEPAPAADEIPAPTARPPKPAPAARPAPAPSAGKGLIAVRGPNGIYLVSPNSAEAHKVSGTADMSAPAWSPDEGLLAVEQVEKGGSTSIYTIWPNGTHPELVLSNASSPSWSADGNQIYAVRNECTTPCDPEDDDANVLYSVNLDGSNVQRVDFEDADVYEGRALAWPTDGTAIHFFDEDSLTGPGAFDSSDAIWSPDGAQLVFAGSADPTDEAAADKTGLWIVSADGGKPRLLLDGATGRPSWVGS